MSLLKGDGQLMGGSSYEPFLEFFSANGKFSARLRKRHRQPISK